VSEEDGKRISYGTVRLLDRGVVTIPKSARDALGWGPGTPVRISKTPEGIVIARADETDADQDLPRPQTDRSTRE
jgi:AbrB family looped-hinge helix DNA binding protein